MKTQKCPLRDDYKAWSEAKKADRLFMVCPACGVDGSHVEMRRTKEASNG